MTISPDASRGVGHPSTLVLLPGMEGNGIVFRPLAASAPAGVEVVTIAYPPGATNGYDDLLPLVRAILPRDRPFHLLGWSFSGPLALMAAAERPSLLRGVILASSFVARPSWFPRWTRHLARPWVFRLYPAAAQAKALLGRYATPELRALLAEAHATAGAEALACRVRAALTVDASAELATCPVPILYLRASRDEVIRARCADEIRRALPTVEIAEIAGPHLALVTNPSASWVAIRTFMERTRASRFDQPQANS
jgi:pimeloyl-ACP methyl ester carboxylesterase